MGTQHIHITQSKLQYRRSGFRRLFVWYFLGILSTTFLLTCILELVSVFLVALIVQDTSIFAHNHPLQILVIVLLVALPFIVLVTAILFFARLLERKIRQPVSELMQAVEKIRQRDLNFSINYHGRNELGDLCCAFNELRHELQESLEREWHKQEGMRTMIAALSHDLRTPATIIQGHIEGLVRAEAGEKRNERLERYLPVLEANTQRMTRLLSDMLLVASLEQTDFIIQPEYVRLEEEMERKAQMYRLQAAAHKLTFAYTYHNSSAQREQVSLDLHRVEQVLDNLFENALRYTPTDGTISFTCSCQQHALLLVLSDTGCGIAPEDMPHVFEKFYQGRAQLHDKARKAAGLGLYTCKQLVEMQGGTITIHSNPANGCEVTLCIPIGSVTDSPEHR